MTTPSPHAQTLRALVLSAVASGTATTAHAVGGGHLVSATGVVVAGALLTGATLPFVRGHLTATRSVALLSALQVVAHVVHGLTALASGAGGQAATGSPHEAHGIRPLGRIATDPLTHDHAGGALVDLLPSPAMLLAHAVAAVVVGALLARGEQSWARARVLLAPLTDALRVERSLRRLARWCSLELGLRADERLLAADLADAVRRPVPRDVWRAPTPARRGPPSLLLT